MIPDTASRIREHDIIPALNAWGVKKARHGRYWHCPIHKDKTPSASIFRNRLHCFTCDKHWSSIDIVMELERVDFKAAVRRLADFYGIPIDNRPLTPEENRRYAQQRSRAERAADDLTRWRRGCIELLRTWRNFSWELANDAQRWLWKHAEADWDNPRLLSALRCITDLQWCGDELGRALEGIESLTPTEVSALRDQLQRSQENAA